MRKLVQARLRRRSVLGVLAAAGAAGLPPCGAAESYTMRLSLPQAANSVAALASLRFASAVRRRSNGQINVEVYANGQLVKQQETIDALINGVIDFALIGATFVEAVAPRYQVTEMPFLFKDATIAHKIIDGPLGAGLVAELGPRGLIGLSWTGSFHQVFTSTRVVRSPDDMKGLRVRVSGSAVSIATYQALGSIPVTVDTAEIITAVSQHTIDGIDTVLDQFTAAKYYTVAKHVAMLNLNFALNVILGSKRKVEALPPHLQHMLVEEGKALNSYWRGLVLRESTNDVKLLQGAGVSSTEPDVAPFRKLSEPVYTAFQARLGNDLIDQFRRAASV
jgi:TRAP-type transport system periplasmic protein